MNYIPTNISGVWILEPRLFPDARGYFMETYRKADFDAQTGCVVDFVQDNESFSSRGVLRGLHMQCGGYAQAKLVRVMQGEVFDVAVDVRAGSDTYGKYVAVELSAENRRQLFIPRGFLHGFLVLSETAQFAYKVDNVYSPQAEQTVAWNDPLLAIAWPLGCVGDTPILSEKDLAHALPLSVIEPWR